MVSGAMESFRAIIHLKCSSHGLLLFIIWKCCFQDVIATQTPSTSNSDSHNMFVLSKPPAELFDPIDISPILLPPLPSPGELLPPMYPSFPVTYDPILTGKCPVNFSAISDILEMTASDCYAPLASLIGNVICCPQVNSLLHIFQGNRYNGSYALVLQQTVADDCFKDIMSILASKGANNTIPMLCSLNSSVLTGGSCPVKDVITFEKIVNTSKLLDACGTVDQLKECCRPSCESAIADAAFRISLTESSVAETANVAGITTQANALSDCKAIVYAWLSRKLPADAANPAFRILSSCTVNKVCPLKFEEPSAVIKACKDTAAPNPSCCSSLTSYIMDIQKQMLITNRQAINCATLFGSMLQKGGVMMNVYELCDIDLKDFSIQANGQQGCLLRSFPADVVLDNSSGVSFTCDLNDNIAAPWPLTSSLSSLSFCAPEMALPDLPKSETSGNPALHCRHGFLGTSIIFFILLHVILQNAH